MARVFRLPDGTECTEEEFEAARSNPASAPDPEPEETAAGDESAETETEEA